MYDYRFFHALERQRKLFSWVTFALNLIGYNMLWNLKAPFISSFQNKDLILQKVSLAYQQQKVTSHMVWKLRKIRRT
jgi:hypothetical protein